MGSAIVDISEVTKALQEKTNLLEPLGERMRYLPAHEGFFLLKHSLAIPKILFQLQTAPCYLSSQLLAYDNLLRRLLSDITNVHLEQDTTWLQATLSTSNGVQANAEHLSSAPSALNFWPRLGVAHQSPLTSWSLHLLSRAQSQRTSTKRLLGYTPEILGLTHGTSYV